MPGCLSLNKLRLESSSHFSHLLCDTSVADKCEYSVRDQWVSGVGIKLWFRFRVETKQLKKV